MSLIVKDWKRVLAIGYSTWCSVLAIFCLSIPSILWAFRYDVNPVVFGRLALMFMIGGLVGRFLDQGEKGKWVRRLIICTILIGAASLSVPAVAHSDCIKSESYTEKQAINSASNFIARWEGLRLKAYLDTSDIPTICYGYIKGVYLGMVKTKDECDYLLRKEVISHRDGFLRYASAETIAYRLTLKRDTAFTSFTYNVGVRAYSRSTALRRLNRGDIEGSCKALTWFNRSGGRVVPGLVYRRNDEYKLCMEGV